ncbi:SRPBCC family protein [Aestuariimicrobium soli]|uniref:SRPBCC family protein n=1 Tax=Aestuariimicrobium soli TaxID=2035834 RepID=UPI003EBFAB32
MTDPMVIEVVVPLSVQDLWTLCTTEDGLSQWWWPHLRDTTYQIDPRPFHRYRFASAAAGIGVHGDYIVVEKFGALEFSWIWEDDGPPVTDHVRVTFTPRGRKTAVRITHTMTEPSPAGRQDYLTGWHDTVDRLVNLHLVEEVAARAS